MPNDFIVNAAVISTPGNIINGGIHYPTLVSDMPFPATTNTQVMNSSTTLNLTSGLVGHTLFVSCSTTATATAVTPTSSSSTSGVFLDGIEITVVNISAAPSSTLLIPSTGLGVLATAPVTISGGASARFMYIANLQTWIPI